MGAGLMKHLLHFGWAVGVPNANAITLGAEDGLSGFQLGGSLNTKQAREAFVVERACGDIFSGRVAQIDGNAGNERSDIREVKAPGQFQGVARLEGARHGGDVRGVAKCGTCGVGRLIQNESAAGADTYGLGPAGTGCQHEQAGKGEQAALVFWGHAEFLLPYTRTAGQVCKLLPPP